MQVLYKYFAIKPISAEHPVGSGIVVDYQPGQEVPASDWGRAADNLVELGKVARVAFNVPSEGDPPVETVSVTLGVEEPAGAVHVTQEKRGPGRPKKRQP